MIKFGILSIFFLIMPFLFGDNGNEFQILIFLIGLLMGFFAFKSYKRINETGVVEEFYKPNEDATEYEKIKFYKRYIYITLVSVPILSFFIIDDINNFENGSAGNLSLWWPVAILYKYYGYWVGVLSVPLLGVILVLGFIFVIKKIKWKYNKNNSTLIKRY
jgi:hypothetical protein